MVEKIKKLLALIKLYREVKGADAGAEMAGLKRAGKSLLIAALVAVFQGLAAQAGPGCGLGPDACKVLADPTVGAIVLSGLLGLEKTLNERFGLGIQVLDTVKRD